MARAFLPHTLRDGRPPAPEAASGSPNLQTRLPRAAHLSKRRSARCSTVGLLAEQPLLAARDPGGPATCPSPPNQEGLRGLSTAGTAGLQTGRFTVAATLPVSYTVEETHDLLNLDNKNLLRSLVPDSFPPRLGMLPSDGNGQRRFIIVDETVCAIYGRSIEKYMQFHRVEYELLSLPTHEVNKDFDLVFRVAERLEAFKLNRRQDPIIAIGGGVCLDVAGLAANLYRRNTPLIKVPTTVMAAVDASIGIKTAVNFHGNKNKLGTYCPPMAVFMDPHFLRTLDRRHLSNGAAEILKMACIKDAELFELLEMHGAELIDTHFQSTAGVAAMRRSIQGMLEELEGNLWEHVLMRVVDYGHTFSPAIEMAALHGATPMLLHGEAVNIDMAITTQIAHDRGMLSASERDRTFAVMQSLGLEIWHDCCNNLSMLLKGLADSTRARDGLQRLPVMAGIGRAVFVNDLRHEEVAKAVQYVAARSGEPSGLLAGKSIRMGSASHLEAVPA